MRSGEWSRRSLNIRIVIVGPKGSKTWDWRITGTEHDPGIQVADLNIPIGHQKFIDTVDIVILSLGMHKVLRVADETKDFLESKGIAFWSTDNDTKDILAINGKGYCMLQTEKAVKLYNELLEQGKKVGILIHSTC